MTAAKIMDIISRLPGCDGQAADAVPAYTQVNMEDAHKLFKKIQSRNVQTFGFVYHDTNGLNHGPVWKTPSFLLNEIYMVILWQDYLWERRLFFSVYVDDIKLAGKKQNIDPMWILLNKEVDLGEPTSFLDHVYLGCTQRQCEISKDIADNYRTMFESRISAVRNRKNYHSLKIFVFLHGLMIWKVMPRNVWNDIVS